MRRVLNYFALAKELQRKQYRERPELLTAIYVYWDIESKSTRNGIISKLLKANILVKIWKSYQVVEHTKYRKK